MRISPGIAKAITAALAFGLFSVWVSIEYRAGANIGGTISLRLLGAMPLAWVIWRRGGLRALRGPPRLILALIVLQGGTSLMYVAALERLPPADVVTVVYAYPAITFVGAVLLGWAKLRLGAVAAVVLCCAGVLIAVGGPSGSLDAVGIGLAAGAAVAYAFALLLTQRLIDDHDPLLLGSVVTLTSIVAQVCGFAIFSAIVLPATTGGWLAGLATGIFSTTLSYLLLYSAIETIGASVASVVLSLELVTAIVGAAIVLGEPIGPSTVLGATLIIAAVVLVGRSGQPAMAEVPP